MEGSKQHQPDEVTTVDVIVEVDSLRAQELLRQNVPYSLEGLDTERPMLTLGDVTLFGTFEQILGTEVVFDVTGIERVEIAAKCSRRLRFVEQ